MSGMLVTGRHVWGHAYGHDITPKVPMFMNLQPKLLGLVQELLTNN